MSALRRLPNRQALASDLVEGSASAPQRDISGVVAPPPLIFLAGLAVGFALEALLPGSSLPDAVAWILGGALLLAGLALLFSFERAFTRKKTPGESLAADDRDRHRRARTGSRATRPTWAWRWCTSASPCCSQALWVLLPLPVVLAIIDRGVIAREERYLERKFGQEYLDYKRSVRRWIYRSLRAR